MKRVSRHLTSAAVIAISVITATTVRGDDGDRDHEANRYLVTDLVSDVPINKNMNPTIDPVLRNAWGITFTPAGSPFWIADNATGCSTLYDGQGTPLPQPTPLQVKIPLPGGKVPLTACNHAGPNNPPSPAPAAPTGVVWNPTTNTTTGFLVPNQSPPKVATFIFDTEDGTISAWTGGLTPPDAAVLAVDNSPGAVYKGLAFGLSATKGALLFATNFRGGTVDVFDHTYTKVTSFTDPDLPHGFAPFGIQNIEGNLFVTYAKQDSAKHDDVAGRGNGFVDIFDTDGNLLRRFASRGTLNSPWGVARASFAFGRFSGQILVGNFGDGKINVFDSNGRFLDHLEGRDGKPLVIGGLWTLTLGGGAKSSPDTLFFAAGPNDEKDGLFGTITPVSNTDDNN